MSNTLFKVSATRTSRTYDGINVCGTDYCERHVQLVSSTTGPYARSQYDKYGPFEAQNRLFIGVEVDICLCNRDTIKNDVDNRADEDGAVPKEKQDELKVERRGTEEEDARNLREVLIRHWGSGKRERGSEKKERGGEPRRRRKRTWRALYVSTIKTESTISQHDMEVKRTRKERPQSMFEREERDTEP